MAPVLPSPEVTADQNTSLDSIKTESTAFSPETDQKDSKEEDPPLILTDSYHEFQKILKPFGFKVKDVLGDGNCLFRALSDQLYGVESYHADIREDICDYLMEHETHFSEFFFSEFETFREHVANMKQLSTYADNLELSAFANLYHVDVHIFQTDRSDALVISGIPLDDKPSESKETKRIVNIVYHSWEHYSSVSVLEDHVQLSPEEPKEDVTAKLLSPEPCLIDTVAPLPKEGSLLSEASSTDTVAAGLLSFDALFDKEASEGPEVAHGLSTPLGSPPPSQSGHLELITPTTSSLTAPSGSPHPSREQSPEIPTPTISSFSPHISHPTGASKVRKFVEDTELLPQCSKRRKFTHSSTYR